MAGRLLVVGDVRPDLRPSIDFVRADMWEYAPSEGASRYAAIVVSGECEGPAAKGRGTTGAAAAGSAWDGAVGSAPATAVGLGG
eukprot:gene43824-46749_t